MLIKRVPGRVLKMPLHGQVITSHKILWYEITCSHKVLLWCCGGVITHPCRFRYTCVWAYIQLRTFHTFHVRTMTTERAIWMHMDDQSHPTLWWCCGGVGISTLEWIFQCLIVPHSNNTGSHREISIRNRESGGQNDMDEVVYFHLQA